MYCSKIVEENREDYYAAPSINAKILTEQNKAQDHRLDIKSVQTFRDKNLYLLYVSTK